jgi:membrane-bound serine protease (ClpP class)
MGLIALFAAPLAAWAALLSSVSAPGDVFVATIRNEIIHPLTAQYLVDSVDRADEEGAALLLIEIDTPGGIVQATESIVQRILAAKTPIAVHVTPSGAHAASAGFILMLSADVAAMSPGTHTGAAHPIGITGVAGVPQSTKDDIGLEKAESDLTAFARALAEPRGRNVVQAQEGVKDSVSFTDSEALADHLIELVARDRAELLEKLDGRTVRRFDGTETVLHTRGPVRELEKSFLQAALGPLLHPQIVLLLLGLGVMGLYVEISHPGMIFPGVVGVLCLLLAALAFQFLPVNTVGLLLVALGIGLFVLELKVTSYGLLTLGGFACLLFGLLMIFPSDVPALRVSLGFVMPLAVTMAGVMGFVLLLVARSQRTPVTTGEQGMIGESGRAATDVAPVGKVYVHGETWDARSASPVAGGEEVRVVAIEGARLVIEKKEVPA